MPFINVKTSAELTEEKIEKIKTELGQTISLFPGKSEAWLMVNIEEGCKLYFKGNDNKNTAFVDVAVLGSTSKSDCEKVTGSVCEILERLAGVPSDRTYVKFEDCDKWGFNGFMF